MYPEGGLVSRILSKASQRLIDALAPSFVSKAQAASHEVIESFLTHADAVILSRAELRSVLEQYTEQLLSVVDDGD